MKIALAGTGYVGLYIATLLSQNHDVMAVDIIPGKVEKINKRISTIQNEYIDKYLKEKIFDSCIKVKRNIQVHRFCWIVRLQQIVLVKNFI